MHLASRLLVGATLSLMAAPVVAGSAAAGQADARAQAKLAKAIAGRVPGKPVRCLNLHEIQSSQIIDRTAIVYRTAGDKVYVNRPTSGARSLDQSDVLVTKTFSSQLCSIDVVRLYDTAARMPTGFVGLGEFIPYTRVKVPR